MTDDYFMAFIRGFFKGSICAVLLALWVWAVMVGTLWVVEITERIVPNG